MLLFLEFIKLYFFTLVRMAVEKTREVQLNAWYALKSYVPLFRPQNLDEWV